MTTCQIWKVRVPGEKTFTLLLPTPEYDQVRRLVSHLEGVAEEPTILSETETWFEWLKAGRPSRLAKEEFYGRMARQMESGAPITEALEAQGRDNRNMHLRRVALDILLLLADGKDPATAFGMHSEIFSPEELAVIDSGFRAGHQWKAFAALEVQNRSIREIGSAVRQASISPLLSLALTYAAIMVFSFRLLPGMKAPFSKIHDLPLATKMELAMSDFFVANPWAAVAIPATFVGAIVFRERLKIDWIFASAIGHVPVIGAFFRKGRMARLAQTMAMLKESGVPELEMLQRVRNVSPDPNMQRAIDQMRESLLEGKPVEEASVTLVSIVGNDAVELLQAIQAGARSGDMKAELSLLAARLEKEFTTLAANITKPMELVLTIIVGGVICVLAYGVYIPLFDLGDALSH